MSKIESFTLHDMHHAVQRASGGEMRGNIQPVYNAYAHLARNGERTWTKQGKLSDSQPKHLNHPQTTDVFRVMRNMVSHPEHKDGKILVADGVDTRTLWIAEMKLFTGDPNDLPQTAQPSTPLQWHHPDGDNRRPYVVRGHHLHHFADIEDMTPEEKTEQVIEALQIGQDTVLAKPDLYSVFAPWYFTDTIGTTPQTREIFSKKLETYTHEYDELPDDFPLEIRAASKDAICNSCDIGDHCKVRRFPLRKSGAVEYDTSHIEIFVQEAVRLGYRDNVKLIEGEVTFTHEPSEIVEGVRMDAGTFKKVLADSPVKWSEISESIDFKNKI